MFARDFLVTKSGRLERGFSSIERCRFHDLWDTLNATRSFGRDVNPWVVAYSFTVERHNVYAEKPAHIPVSRQVAPAGANAGGPPSSSLGGFPASHEDESGNPVR